MSRLTLISIIVFALLVLAHPAAVALVLGPELAACAVAVVLIRRAYRRGTCVHWRSA